MSAEKVKVLLFPLHFYFLRNFEVVFSKIYFFFRANIARSFIGRQIPLFCSISKKNNAIELPSKIIKRFINNAKSKSFLLKSKISHVLRN